MIRVFLDATCWIAAAGSPSGGSSALLELSSLGSFRIVTVTVTVNHVLIETERNIRDKMTDVAFDRYMAVFSAVRPDVADNLMQDEWAHWLPLVPEKDCHVLAGAVKAKADALVSLDRKHILTDTVREHFPIPVYDTKEFLTRWREQAL